MTCTVLDTARAYPTLVWFQSWQAACSYARVQSEGGRQVIINGFGKDVTYRDGKRVQ